jgi:hypothetical protein
MISTTKSGNESRNGPIHPRGLSDLTAGDVAQRVQVVVVDRIDQTADKGLFCSGFMTRS